MSISALQVASAVAAMLMSLPSQALDWSVTGRVTLLEPTFADHLNIRIDAAAGTCPAGGWLFFYGAGSTAEDKRASIKAVYAGLLASMYAGQQVVVIGVNQGCVVEQVHLLGS